MAKIFRQDRVVRVFVSSTFRDMYKEREVLVKHVFPRVRKICEKRGVTFTEVDLRWGITEEQAERGEVLPVCLAEIERCRPYFLGFLGERYGWIPDSISAELFEWPWLAESRGCSITELEILHAVLNDSAMATRSFFYFRDPAYAETLPVGQRDDSQEERGSQIREQAGRRGKLESLKERIRRSGVPVRENYPDPEALVELVSKDLDGVIDQDFPPGSTLDPLDREAAEHEAFARTRTGVYVGRPESFEQLDAHAAAGGPLVVLGESGSGKSALLANWAGHHRSVCPDDCVLLHFVGASADSADWAAMLRRILGELKRHFAIDQPIPETPGGLRPAFARWLQVASTRASRIVLIIDALNQLKDQDGALDLVWLPTVLPGRVCLLVSTLPGQPLDELERRGWPALVVRLLEPAERRRLIVEYLGQSTKQLRAERMERIAAADEAANPLYLRALLEELRVWGAHEGLDGRIEHYLGAKTIPDLYERILDRYETDYERDRPGLVREVMSLLWAARRGLSEGELLDLLGENGLPLPGRLWSPLFLAAEASLVNRSGLLGFFHGYMRQAVHNRYLSESGVRTTIHRRLADYFSRAELGRRKVEELQWQLVRSHELDRLHELLQDLEFFAAAFAADRADLKQSWSLLEHEPMHGFRMADAYRTVIEDPAAHPDVAGAVGSLLNETGQWEDYSRLSGRLIDHYRRAGDRDRLSIALSNQASLLIRKGAFEEAAALLAEQREILDQTRNPRALEVWLGTMAMLMWERGDLTEAWTALGGQEEILRDLGDKDRLAGCLVQKSFILHSRGQHPEALALLQQAMRLAQETSDPEARQAILGEMAVNHMQMGDLDLALKLLEEQADLCRQLGDLESLAGCFGNQGDIHLARGDRQTALALYQGMERIGKEIGHSRIEHVGRAGQAQVFLQAGHLDRAGRLLEGIPEHFRTNGMKDPLWHALLLEGDLRLAQGKLAQAMDSYTEAVEVCGQISPPGEVAGLLRAVAAKLLAAPERARRTGGLFTLEEFEQAVSRFDRTPEPAAKAVVFLQRAAVVDPTSADTHYFLGVALETVGRNEEALAAYRRALALRPGWTDAEVRLAELLLHTEDGR